MPFPEKPDFTKKEDRDAFVDALRDHVLRAFGDVKLNCGNLAVTGAQILNGYGQGEYKVVAGRLEQHPPNSRVLVLFEGGYSGDGKSKYHAWIVGPDGNVIDASAYIKNEVGPAYIWLPYTTNAYLKYIPTPECTDRVEKQLSKKASMNQAGDSGEAAYARWP
jgi:hypothetical protein